ncbi:MAG TPA: alpha/beta hydrolase [Kofleriaceae bacterium]|nr:alpha/beta hydrolase [Kofleriaceae bacterium]
MEYTRRFIPGSSGASLSCCHTEIDRGKPSVLIVLPFGLPLDVARAAFDRLGPTHNVVTWETRYILSLDQEFSGTEKLAPDEHVADMLHILAALQIDTCNLIGYCSGASISLLAASRHPEVFTSLILVNGEYMLFKRGHASTDYQRSIEAFLPAIATSRRQASLIFARMGEISMASRKGEASELDKQINLPFSKEEYLFRYAKTYMAFRELDALALAKEVRQRTFVLTGRLDVHSSMENSEAVGDSIGGCKRYVDDVGDHYEFCRAGSATLDEIAAYLAEVA